MPLRTPRRTPAVALASLALFATLAFAPAHAAVWAEVGDAGETLSGAQLTIGAGTLNGITGSLASANDVDIYCVRLNGVPPMNLPFVDLACVVTGGPNVWLFDSAGNGVFSNMTCQFSSKYIVAPGSGLTPGNYYLAVSFTGRDPQSAGGAIWSAALGQRLPDGPGAPGPLTGWAGTGSVQPSNPYQITLGFFDYCDAATPAFKPTWGALKLHYGN